MYCKTDWYIPHRVIYHHFYGPFGVNSIYNALHGSRNLVSTWQYRPEQIKPMVYMLADMTDVEDIQLSLKDIPRVQDLMAKYQSRQYEMGWFVMMYVHPSIRKTMNLMMSVISQSTNMRFRLEPNLHSALDFLTHIDNELVDRLGKSGAAD